MELSIVREWSFHDTEFINFSAQKNTHKKHDQKSLETLINA